MKSPHELRSNRLLSRCSPVSIGYLRKAVNKNIDFDVFLPTKNMNLQRGFVWTDRQKRELIMSILLRRFIPHVSILVIDNNDEIGKVVPDIDKIEWFRLINFNQTAQDEVHLNRLFDK